MTKDELIAEDAPQLGAASARRKRRGLPAGAMPLKPLEDLLVALTAEQVAALG